MGIESEFLSFNWRRKSQKEKKMINVCGAKWNFNFEKCNKLIMGTFPLALEWLLLTADINMEGDRNRRTTKLNTWA